MTFGLRRSAILVLVAALVGGCTPPGPPVALTPPPSSEIRDLTAPFAGAAELPPPDLRDDGPGSLVSVKRFGANADLDEVDATAFRVVYRSTSETGEPTEVSGLVAIPPGPPPKAGWPVVSFGHGTSGVLNRCAPTMYENLLGNAPMIAALVQNGFLVAMTDYEGLGVPGFTHPYLDSRVFGQNMIDAVRAARRIDPRAGRRWAAYGVSLGGMAAWAAADQAGRYGAGLSLVGTAALVPVADMTLLADAAANGSLTREQMPLLAFALQGMAWSHPDFDLADYVSGYTRAHWDELLDCTPTDPGRYASVVNGMQATDLRPATREATARLRELLRQMALPQHPATGPLLVQFGTMDPLVNDDWTKTAIRNACAQGDVVDFEERIGEGHADLDSSRSLPWVKARFDGQRPFNGCAGQR
ncbi:lipase family protein [Mycobacterium sp. M26]|uniref:lipase family protein n=1 Tax=Mycobacterium sp. M26 TaxID=1762962 RepID=UPI00073F4828|nr:lipase family protein [Mycobacterium sp. M26]